MKEVWKDISGYEGYYQVSTSGNVRSKTRKVYNPRYGEQLRLGKMLSPAINKNGYVQVGLSKNGIRKSLKVHSLVAKAFLKEITGKKEVNHKDGNKLNNHIDNLEWCNRSENVLHAFRSGLKTKPKGAKNGQSKITSKEVLEIRSIYKGRGNGPSLDKIAEMYNLGRSQVTRIVKRQSWGHI